MSGFFVGLSLIILAYSGTLLFQFYVKKALK